MKIKNKGGFTALILFFIMVSADLVSTLLLWDLIKYLEANPIFEYVGLIGIVALNIAFGTALYYLYIKTKRNIFNRFIYLNLLVTVAILRIVVVANNLQTWMAKPTIQQAQAVTQQMKTETITQFWWLSFVPYIIALVTYWFFSKDHKIEVNEE